MANPYYIPRSNTTMNNILGMGELALRLHKIKTDTALQKSGQALTAKELGLKERQLGFEGMKTTAEYGPGGLAERRVVATETAIKMKGIAEGPFQRSNLAPIEGRIAMFDKQNKTGILKAVNPIMQYVKDAADMNATGADVYNGLKQSWPQHKEPVMKSLQEEYNKALMNDNKAAAQTIQGIMADLEKDGVIDSMMPGVAQYVKDKQAMAAAEIAQKTRAPEPKLYDTTEGWQSAKGAIGKIKPTSGMEITTADGTTIRTGVRGTPGGMQKPTAAKVEEKQLAANEGLSRISNIVKSFKPEFQEIPTKLGVAWSSLKSKMGANIPPEEKAKLQEFAAFKQDSLENINLYIKEITGAQMSEKEADRIRRAQPDPGDGIFGGDDPVSFKSKLVNQYKKLRMAAIRQGFYLKQGLGDAALKQLIKNDDVVSLERMEKILDDRGAAYEAEIKKQDPNISTADLFSQVKARLAKEFNTEF